MIKVNLTHSTCKEHVFEFEQEVSKIHQQLHQKTCEGNDFLGWLNYPNEIHPAMIDEINKMAQKVRQNCDVLVVIGIGGSYLVNTVTGYGIGTLSEGELYLAI